MKLLKRLLSGILIMAFITLFFTMSASAASLELMKNDTYEYFVFNDEVTISDYMGYNETEVVIPSVIDGYPVTAIAENAFASMYDVTSLTIPDSVKHIDGWAFQNCPELTHVNFGKGVNYIGEAMFQGCSALKNVTIPTHITEIRRAAFEYCPIEEIVIPDSVVYIGENAFDGCNELAKVTIGNGVKIVDNYAFSGCGSLEKIVIPDGVEKIGRGAFSYCEKLDDITLPTTLTEIGTEAFLYSAYTNYNSPHWEIGKRGDYEYPMALYIGTNLIAVSNSHWDEFSIKEGTTCIADTALAYGPTKIYFPASVKGIGYGKTSAFSSGSHTEYVVDENNENYKSVDGVLYTKDMKTLISVPQGSKITSFTVPASVKYIPSYAFQYYPDLEEVIISEGVEEIGEYAFNYCQKLKKVTFPKTLKKIGTGAFSSCEALEDINLYPGIEEIGENAFGYTACYKNESNWNDDGEFYLGDGLYLLEKHITLPQKVYRIKNGTVLIADKAVSSDWIEDLKIVIPDTVKYVGEYAISTSASDVIVGKGIEKLGDRALGGNVKQAIFSDDLKELGKTLFSYNLNKVYLGNQVEVIPEGTFEQSEITYINIPKSLKVIEDNAFTRCDELTDVYYNGTEEEFNKIKIGRGNETFLNATIHYSVAYGSDKVKATVEDKEIVAKVTPPDDMIGKTVIFGVFRNGVLVETVKAVYTGSELTFKTKEPSDEIKIFMWESVDIPSPYHEPEEMGTKFWF